MRPTGRGLEAAMRRWRRAVGTRQVVVDPGALRAARTATFATAQSVAAILRPADRAEVAACLRIATETGVAVHPVSGGKNWGYGSRVPVRDGGVLLDLGRMDRIVAFDERLGYVTVEPGVTFRRLHRFLRTRRSGLHATPIGSTPDASPLANALERGIGQGPPGDRFAGLCDLEVVLPTGRCVRTGFSRFPGAAAAPLHRWGLGPALDGLFSQSNLGVVTRGTLWLAPIPRHADVLSATLGRRGDLAGLVDAIRPLFQRGALRYPVKLVNDYRWLSLRRQHPGSRNGGAAPLSRRAVEAAFVRPTPWIVSGVIEHATPRHRAPTRRLVRDALAAVCDAVVFRTEAEVRAAHPSAWEELHRPTSGFDVASTYWRKRDPPPRRMDPDRDGCGALWTSPVVPLVGRHVARVARIVERAATAAGFEPMIGVTVLDGRAAHVVAPLFFDRAVPGEDGRALACAEALTSALVARGYYPYRLGVSSMGLLPRSGPDDAALRRALKGALDPAGILSPGRYDG